MSADEDFSQPHDLYSIEIRVLTVTIQCSGAISCDACVRSSYHCRREDPKLKRLKSPSLSLCDVDIYTLGIRGHTLFARIALISLDFPCNQETYIAILNSTQYNVTGHVYRSYNLDVTWDIQSLALDVSDWLRPKSSTGSTHSCVWLFSSPQSEQVLSQYLKRNLTLALRVLVETTSAIYNLGGDAAYQDCSNTDLWSIRSFAGSQLLTGLESALNDRRLAGASLHELKALFLILFGAMLAVSYSISASDAEIVGTPYSEHYLGT